MLLVMKLIQTFTLQVHVAPTTMRKEKCSEYPKATVFGIPEDHLHGPLMIGFRKKVACQFLLRGPFRVHGVVSGRHSDERGTGGY